MPDVSVSDVAGLAALLARGNPAPYAGFVDLPDGAHPGVPAGGLRVVSASPELFQRRDGSVVVSGPIKGTGRSPDDLGEKDSAENVARVTADPAFATLWRTAHSVGAGQLRAVDGTYVVRSPGSIENGRLRLGVWHEPSGT